MSPDSSTLDARKNQNILVVSSVTVTKIAIFVGCNCGRKVYCGSGGNTHALAAPHISADQETDQTKLRLGSNSQSAPQVRYFLQRDPASPRLCQLHPTTATENPVSNHKPMRGTVYVQTIMGWEAAEAFGGEPGFAHRPWFMIGEPREQTHPRSFGTSHSSSTHILSLQLALCTDLVLNKAAAGVRM